ncbi:MAG TPA: DUF4382 domain-containing protein [Burkholderiaceae bacterium]|nr:DUF4382 domain-containing protein [Burkholderiaceae bacterium]
MRSMWATALVAAVLGACGGGGGGGIGGTGRDGTMHVSMTDAPSCGFDHVYVTVDRVRVNQSSTAADGDAGWSEVVLSPARRVDLLSLTNGVLEDLGSTQLPSGKYTQLRLVLVDNDSTTPLANSVVPTGGSETALDTPSAQQSGLKINVDLDVAADQIADVVIDFDACKSVVQRGNSGRYNLKPVLSATPLVSAAGMRVVGYVDPALGVSSTLVSVQANGVPVKATVPDATGKFVLYPVPAGTYDLVVTATGRATAVMTGVPVVTTAFTTVNSTALPIVPPTATMRMVTGTVTPATATVRATQTLTGGPTIEAAWGAVDATSGAFSFSLPIGAPVKTAYVANPTTLNFTADSAAAGKYTLQAASAGATKIQAIDVNNAVAPVTFTFP